MATFRPVQGAGLRIRIRNTPRVGEVIAVSVDGVAGFVPGVVAIRVDVLPISFSVHGD